MAGFPVTRYVSTVRGALAKNWPDGGAANITPRHIVRQPEERCARSTRERGALPSPPPRARGALSLCAAALYPARGNEKGKVERQIQYLRHAFFAARPFRDLDDLHAQFSRWRDDVAHQRRHPEHLDRSVATVLAEEQRGLLPLPAHPFETTLVKAVRSGKQPDIRFDRNLYHPHTDVHRPLTLCADHRTVRLVDGVTERARHPRSYDSVRIARPTWPVEDNWAFSKARATNARGQIKRWTPSATDSATRPFGAHRSSSTSADPRHRLGIPAW